MNVRSHAPMAHPGYPTFRRTPHGPLARFHGPRTSGTMEEIQAFLDKESIPGVKNKYTLSAAVILAGVVYYGHTQRWF